MPLPTSAADITEKAKRANINNILKKLKAGNTLNDTEIKHLENYQRDEKKKASESLSKSSEDQSGHITPERASKYKTETTKAKQGYVMYFENKSLTEISKALNVHYNTVSRWKTDWKWDERKVNLLEKEITTSQKLKEWKEEETRNFLSRRIEEKDTLEALIDALFDSYFEWGEEGRTQATFPIAFSGLGSS